MVELVRKQRHFLNLMIQTPPKQRKRLLETITRDQLKAFSQIAHNIVKAVLVLTPSEKDTLRKRRRVIHLLSNKRTGYERKKQVIQGQQTALVLLLRIALTHLKSVME